MVKLEWDIFFSMYVLFIGFHLFMRHPLALLVGYIYICLTTNYFPTQLSAFPYLISRDLLPFKRALLLPHNSLKYVCSKTQSATKPPPFRHDGFIHWHFKCQTSPQLPDEEGRR